MRVFFSTLVCLNCFLLEILFSQNTGSAYFSRNAANARLRVLDGAPANGQAIESAYKITGTALTLEAWVYPMTIPDTLSQAEIIERPANGGIAVNPYHVFSLNLNHYGPLRFAASISDGTTPSGSGGDAFVTDTTKANMDTWTHVAATYDGATLKLYINGVLRSQVSAAFSIGTGATGFFIGSYGGFEHFKGLIDEARIWNVARSQSQIQASMNSQLVGNESGLRGYWRLNEATGATIASDQTVNHNDLNALTGATFVNSPEGSSVSFMIQTATAFSRIIAGSTPSYNISQVLDAYPSNPTISVVDVNGGLTASFNGTSFTLNPYAAGQFKIRISASVGSLSGQFTLTGYIDEYPTFARTHNNNNATFSSFNNGKFGADGNVVAGEPTGVGFVFNGQNGLYEGSLMIGKSSTQVIGNLYSHEFATGDTIGTGTLNLPGFAQGYQNSFNDARSINPIGLSVEQVTYSKATAPDDDYVIMEYRIRNTSLADLSGIYVGLNMDWDVWDGVTGLGYSYNKGAYDIGRKMSYIYMDTAVTNPNYYGVVSLGGTVSGMAVYTNGVVNDLQDSAMYRVMTSGPIAPPSIHSDLRSLVAVGPYSIPRFGIINVRFAVVGGTNLADLQTNADRVLSVISANPDAAPVLKLGVLASDVTDQVKIAVASDQGLAFARATVNSNILNMASLTPRNWICDYALTSSSSLSIQISTTDFEGTNAATNKNYTLSKALQSAHVGQFDITNLSKAGYVLSSTAVNEVTKSGWKFLNDGLQCLATHDNQETVIKASLPALWLDEVKSSVAEKYDERRIGWYAVDEGVLNYIGGESEKGILSAQLLLSKTERQLVIAYNPDHVVLPKEMTLFQNYPNPFNPSTQIRFFLPEKSDVSLKIYNILGEEVKTLIQNQQDAGFHQVLWDGKNNLGATAASGIYIYTLRTSKGLTNKKMLLIK